MIETRTCDVLVIGGGTAALRAAVAAREAGASVILLRKGPPGAGIVGLNAPLAEMGDSPARFLADMEVAGASLGDRQLAAAVTGDALAEVRFLEAQGLSFRHGASYAPRLTSGHSIPRTLYTTDRTGPDIIAALQRRLRRQDVELRAGRQAVALLRRDDAVCGAVVYDARGRRLEGYRAGAVVLATGGLGPLYAVSTNPADLSGDGYALAFAAGAQLLDMEFVQFEPFVMLPPTSPAFTVSFLLASRPAIYNALRESFLPDGGRGLSKERLAQEVYRQVQEGKGTAAGGVYFDLTTVASDELAAHPRLLAACRAAGLDPSRTAIEVGPAQHYMLGGIRINAQGATTVAGLYAAGEVTGGVHGAGRLAGNSATDVLVMGARAGRAAAEHALAAPPAPLTADAVAAQAGAALAETGIRRLAPQALAAAASALGRALWSDAGLLRSKAGLAGALAAIQELSAEIGACRAHDLPERVRLLQMQHRLLAAEMICRAALLREESRGVHCRTDYPQHDDRHWLCSTVLTHRAGKLAVDYLSRARSPAEASGVLT